MYEPMATTDDIVCICGHARRDHGQNACIAGCPCRKFEPAGKQSVVGEMDSDDLRRRLAKLAALRDHPSMLPAVRAEAARAYDRLRRLAGGTITEGSDVIPEKWAVLLDALGCRIDGMRFPWEK